MESQNLYRVKEEDLDNRMFFGGSSVSCTDPGQGYQRAADAGAFYLRSYGIF